MRLLRFCSAFLPLLSGCIFFSCQGTRSQNATSNGAPSSGASLQILYVIGNGVVSTYAVDKNALIFTTLGQPLNLIPAGSLVQFVPAPNDDFVYVLWSDARNQQHLSVFATDVSGIPQMPAIQTIDAPSLYQFNIHPSARFAYMMQVDASGTEYTATVRLFDANSTDGKLREDPKPQGSYGPYNVWPALLYGFSADGTKIYLSRQNPLGSFYEQRTLNTKTGTLGPDVVLYEPSSGTPNSDMLVIGTQIMVDEHSGTGATGYIDVLPLVPRPRHHLFRCTASILTACATATNVQIDPAGKYLFLTDPRTQQVHVVRIHLGANKLEDTGNAIPMTTETPGFAFSPDGTLVYAVLASDSSLHVYLFNPASGQLISGDTPLPIGSSYGFCPALRR
jgi:Lactonase, 7-bladed beta-propeller